MIMYLFCAFWCRLKKQDGSVVYVLKFKIFICKYILKVMIFVFTSMSQI